MIEDDEEMTKVRANLSSWLAAFNDKDLDALFSLYDENSLYANAGAPLLRGVAQIRPWYEQATAGFNGTLRYREEHAVQDGSLAMLVGIYYFEPPDGNAPSSEASLTGRVCLVYRRDDSGAWKLLFDMDNTPPDVTPASFS